MSNVASTEKTILFRRKLIQLKSVTHEQVIAIEQALLFAQEKGAEQSKKPVVLRVIESHPYKGNDEG